MSLWIAGGTVVAGVGGALISADATQDAQASANRANALAAAQQSSQSFSNYLSSRGINLQQLLQKYPEFQQEYERVRASGEKRDFNTWLAAALQEQPSHPIWNDIANPRIGSGAQNTTLPAWAVDANGNPLQPSLLNQLVQLQGNAVRIVPGMSIDQVLAELQKNPDFSSMPTDWQAVLAEQVAQQGLEKTFSGNASWAAENPDDPNSAFLARWANARGAPAPNPEDLNSNTTTIDPRITELIPGALNTASGIFNGDLYRELQGAMTPVADARAAGVDAQRAKIDEQRKLSTDVRDTELAGLGNVLEARRTGAGNIYDATISGATGVRDASTQAAREENAAAVQKLAELLGVRLEAAQQIYDATAQGSAGVRDARTTGAKGVYDAELLRADTFAQSSEQALNRLLAAQSAERARRGFGGGSSGSDLTRARLTADYTQRGAGARADAGVNYQGRLSDAGVGYAQDMRGAGVGRATTIGQSREADVQARLNAAVQLARQLGVANIGYANTAAGAGVGRAGTLASADESDAIGRLTAQVEDARRKMGYLTSDADIAAAKAQEQNAMDQLNALIADQNRRTSSIGLPWSLGQNDLALKSTVADTRYDEIDAILKRLGSFQTQQTSGPSIITAPVSPVMSNQQIIGGALSGLGSALGTYGNNQQIQDLIRTWGSSGSTASTAPLTYTQHPTYAPLTGTPSYLAGATVFGGP